MRQILSARFVSATVVLTSMVAVHFTSNEGRAETLVLLPPLRIGETMNLEMTMTRERNVAGKPPTKTVGTTPVRVEVLDVTDKQTVIGWTTGKPKIEDPRLDAQNAKNVEPWMELATGQTVELVFDEEFLIHSIRNLNQVIELSKKAIDLVQQSLPKDEKAAVIVARMREMFANPDTVQNLAMQKPGRYFVVYGWELEPGKPRKVETSLPNPFGTDPLPAEVTIELKPSQPADQQYVVLYKQKLDQEGVQRIIREAVLKFAGDKLPPGQQFPKFDVDDSGEFKINKSTGWVEHALVKRATTSNDGSQTETYEFRSIR